MSETPKPYLYLVHTDADADADADANADEGAAEATVEEAAASDPSSPALAAATPAASPADLTPLNHPLQQAIMHAAVAWVELCVERTCYAVDIQPVARRMYEVSVHYADGEDARQEAVGEGIILRVRLDVEPGLALRTTVEPVRPS